MTTCAYFLRKHTWSTTMLNNNNKNKYYTQTFVINNLVRMSSRTAMFKTSSVNKKGRGYCGKRCDHMPEANNNSL